MPDLDFRIASVQTVPFAAAPMVSFGLHVRNVPAEEKIHSVALRCQIQVEVTKRKYTSEEQEKLRDLFGEPGRWSQTLRNLLWTHVSSVVPAFAAETTVDVQVPCSFDFNVAATKYFYGLQDGEIPLVFQFSGTVFYQDGEAGLSVAPISWDKESKFRLPVKTWCETMEMYYPNSAWLCLRKDVFDRLYQYKVRNGILTWEQALENLLSSVEETVSS
jgi:Family of unknown function (DUF6084)